ncbi:MAG: T9SS type A sorting domain-containing protein [Calditrichaceae bacterium]|nr:T9SS type A sorting domain-containing protein [Calditrichaceae bacterium]MBN2708371.1 T9SS type A sorting domain-containing protein [Calditrichaceae bacterium]
MITRIIFSFILVLISISKTYSQGNWELLMPTPTSNPMVSLYFYDDSVGWSVGEYGTILKTTDGGVNWSIKEIPWLTDLSDVYFSTENTGYAIGTDGFIIKSLDGGETWEQLDNQYSNNLNRILFKDSLSGWTIGEKGMILHTADGGNNWLLQTSNSLENLLGIDFVGTDSLCVVGENKTILLADVTDNSWLTVEFATDCSLKDVFFADSTHGWACGTAGSGYSGILLSSADGGHHWQEISMEGYEYHTWGGVSSGTGDGPGLLKQVYFYENLTTGFVLNEDNELYKTTSSGSTWIGYAEGHGDFYGYGRFCVLPGNRIVMSARSGGFRYSDDNGKTIKLPDHDKRWWTAMIAGDYGKWFVLQRFSREKEEYFKFFRSDNYGTSFQTLTPQFYDEFGSEISIDNFASLTLRNYYQDTLWIICRNTSGIQAFYYSVDLGSTYHFHRLTQYSDGLYVLSGDTLIKAHTSLREIEPGIYKTVLICEYSFDGGVTIEHIENTEVWNDITPPSLFNGKGIRSFYFFNGHTGFFVGDEGNILKTTDTGQTWENIYSGVVETLWQIEFIDQSTGFIVGDFGRILKTEDGGVTWRKTNSGTQENIYRIKFVNDLKGWVGTESGLRYTTDGGETWQGVPLRYSHVVLNIVGFPPIIEYYPDVNYYKFIVDHNYLYAVNIPGPNYDEYPYLLRTKIDPTDIYDYDITDLQPKEISLSQNFPNPFNSTTRIKYSLPKQGFVSIKIYNIQGQLVRTLLNRMQVAGNHSVIWDGRSDRGRVVSSGMYIYQIQSNDQTKNRKLLLLK